MTIHEAIGALIDSLVSVISAENMNENDREEVRILISDAISILNRYE